MNRMGAIFVMGTVVSIFGCSQLRADQPPQDQSHVSLTVEADANGTAAGGSSACYDAGIVSMIGLKPIEHSFVLKNETGSVVCIDHLTPSCGCTSAVAAQKTLPYDLDPGQEIMIDVSVDASNFFAGPIRKSVEVDGTRDNHPIANLEIRGMLQSSIYATPSHINFGDVKAGSRRNALMTLYWQSSVLDDEKPVFTSTVPGVSVTPVLLQKHTNASVYYSKTFVVSYSASHLYGSISGTINLVPPPGTKPQDAQRFSIPVLATLKGELTVSPACAVFGLVTHGNATTLTLNLIFSERRHSKSLTLKLPPDMSSRIVSKNGKHLLEITILPDMPPGLLASSLDIIDSHNGVLKVPVTADVVEAQPAGGE